MNIPSRVTECDRQNFFLIFENTSTYERYECFLRKEGVSEYNHEAFRALEKLLKKLFPAMQNDINILSVAQGVEVDIAYEVTISINRQCKLGHSDFDICTKYVPDCIFHLLDGEVSIYLDSFKDLPKTEENLALTKKLSDYADSFPSPLKEEHLKYSSVVEDDYGKLLSLKYSGDKVDLGKHLANWNPIYDVVNKGYLSFAVPLSTIKIVDDIPYTRQSAQVFVMSENNFVLGEVPPEYFRFTQNDLEVVYDVMNRYAEKDRIASALAFAIEKVAKEFAVKFFRIDEKEVPSSLSLLDLFDKDAQKERFMLEGYLKENVTVTIETVIEISEFDKTGAKNTVIQLSSRFSIGTESIAFRQDSFSVPDFTSKGIQSAVFEQITNNEALLGKYGLSKMTSETLMPTLRLQNIFPPVEKKPLIGGREEGVGDKAIPIKIARSRARGRKNKENFYPAR